MCPTQYAAVQATRSASKRAGGSSSMSASACSASSRARDGIRLAHQHHVGESGQRLAFEILVADADRLLPNGLHLDGRRPAGRRAATRPSPPCTAGAASARARPPAGTGGAQPGSPLGRGRAPGLLERRGRLARQIGGRSAVELGEERRGVVEVVRPDLEQLVAGPLAQPLGEARMVLRARRLGQARVGDVADEHVLEAVRGLVLERRARLADDEVAEQQIVDRLVDALASATGARSHRPRTCGR